MGVMHGFEVDASLENIRVDGRLDVWVCELLGAALYREVAAGDGEQARYNDIAILYTISENGEVRPLHPFCVHSQERRPPNGRARSIQSSNGERRLTWPSRDVRAG